MASLYAVDVRGHCGAGSCVVTRVFRPIPSAGIALIAVASACGGGSGNAPATRTVGAAPAAALAEASVPQTQAPSDSAASRQAAPVAATLEPPANLDLSRAPAISLAEGLTIVTAVAEDRGDYESVKRIAAVRKDEVEISYSATMREAAGAREVHSGRVVFTRDLRSGRTYRMAFVVGKTESMRGATALGLSTEVFQEVRRGEPADYSLASIEGVGSMLGALGMGSPEYEGALERVGGGPEPFPIVLDGERQWLPAIHARGRFEGLTGDVDAEFWFLDNADNPLTLRAIVGASRLVAVRIDRPRQVSASHLERELAENERVELPGIYFEFASARLRSESNAAIAEVADLLRRHPTWAVRLEGHTDSIGGAERNLELSRQRADAVRVAIVARLGGGADRLDVAGFGLTRPREPNDTPEGRARNRRVEMVRTR